MRDLREIALGLVDELAITETQYALNGEFLGAIKIGGDPRRAAQSLSEACSGSQQRVAAVDVGLPRIEGLLQVGASRMRDFTSSRAFLDRFPGDRLLRAFAGRHRISGDHFRNACLDAAQRLGLRPEGMEKTLSNALE
jgi:hypothetical protein